MAKGKAVVGLTDDQCKPLVQFWLKYKVKGQWFHLTRIAARSEAEAVWWAEGFLAGQVKVYHTKPLDQSTGRVIERTRRSG